MSRESSGSDSDGLPPVKDKLPWRGDFLELHNAILDTLADSKVDLGDKDNAALLIATAISDAMGGRVLYIPIGYKTVISNRNLAIYSALRDGTATARDLAISHDLSVSTVYQVAANMKMKLGETDEGNSTSPYFQRVANRRRNKEILDAIRLNLATPRELSKKYGVSLGHIRWIAGKLKAEPLTEIPPQENK